MPALNVGDPAPGFTLFDQTGTKRSLSDFKGKKLVLYFYPKDNTSGCTKEACAFQDNLTRLRRSGVEVVGVSADSVVSHKKFADRYGLKFSLLSDTEKKMLKQYGVLKKKNMYGRTYMGIERTTYVIDEKGKITHIFPKVKVDGHVEEVEKALKGER